jgi:hypothetical protein
VGGRRTLKNSQYSWGFAVFRDALAFSFAAEQKIFFIMMSHIFLLDILVEFRTTLQKSSWVIQQQLYMVSVYLFIYFLNCGCGGGGGGALRVYLRSREHVVRSAAVSAPSSSDPIMIQMDHDPPMINQDQSRCDPMRLAASMRSSCCHRDLKSQSSI